MAAVVGVAREHDLLAGAVGVHVVGPGHRQRRMPPARTGALSGTAQKNGMPGAAAGPERDGQADHQPVAGRADPGDVARAPALVRRRAPTMSGTYCGSRRAPSASAATDVAFYDVAERLRGHRRARRRREAKARPDRDRVAQAVSETAGIAARDLGDDREARRAGGVGVVVELGARGVEDLPGSRSS